jgi:hypothetical protein
MRRQRERKRCKHRPWSTSLHRLERSLFRANINSDYNDFVARVALEVVDGWWWKHQLRVKSAGSGRTALSSNEGASGSRYSPSRSFCANLFPQQSLQSWRCLDALEAAGFA